MDGIHFVRVRRAHHPPKWYVYAWRGGPRIMTAEGRAKPKLSTEALAELLRLREERQTANGRSLGGLIAKFRRSPEWEKLSDGTKKTWGSALNTIEARWGETPLSVWSDPRMKSKVVAWRDDRRTTPRAADIGITVLSRLLNFGALRGLVTSNAAAGIPALYEGGSRALIVWTAEDIQRFDEVAAALGMSHVADGLHLAALTGLRRQDLVTLTWDQVGVDTVSTLAAKKSRSRRFQATMPRLPELDALLERLRARDRRPDVNTILVNMYGRAWSGDGFTGRFNRIRDAARIVGIDGQGRERKKHLHDVRGTFCTKLCMAGCTDEQVAEVMGWSAQQVSGIRRTYVDRAAVVVAIADRLRGRV